MKQYITKQTLIAAGLGLVAGGVLAYLNGTFDSFVGKIAAKISPGK